MTHTKYFSTCYGTWMVISPVSGFHTYNTEAGVDSLIDREGGIADEWKYDARRPMYRALVPGVVCRADAEGDTPASDSELRIRRSA